MAEFVKGVDDVDGSISTASREICECCGKLKRCRMYVTQMGEAAWVCRPCRRGGGKDE